MGKTDSHKKNALYMKHVSKQFGDFKALKEVNLEVKEGEIFALLGPSGAGKTTTINLFTAQMAANGGSVKVLDKEVMENRDALFYEMGILTDTSGVYEQLSVYDNLMLFARFFNKKKSDVIQVLKAVSLEACMKKPVGKLSKGMRQRVMIARAVLHKPRILFLDEPTAALDPGTTLEIHKLIRELNASGTTIFLTTHDMFEADKLSDKVAFMNEGRIIDMDSPKALKSKYADETMTIVLKDGSKHVLKKEPMVGAKISKWLEEDKIETMHTNEPNLEQIFLSLTGKELA